MSQHIPGELQYGRATSTRSAITPPLRETKVG
eukprot:CAMPEP_0195641162 /NCGR_PEP_ID=MMETSP0815-20121206/26551_1 /TAXON_ID=97485 /ORGANISM="Prymnesium parvum, Strain Texoma1" /LENGTH=31 /DNA_ID= /DNA_START= /DNA_END= /DNA_ORIENTATION=